MSEKIEVLQKLKQTDLNRYENLNGLFASCRYVLEEDEKLSIRTAKEVNIRSLDLVLSNPRFFDLYNRSLLFLAPYDFDSYMLYIEKKRDADKRYWLPRREVLLPTAKAMQALIDDELDLLTISMPPGAGKQLSDDTPILTRYGWKNHGDLVVGDEVINDKGEFVKVTYIFPKYEEDCLVTFTNGEQIHCHEKHEWVVYDRRQAKTRTVETKQIERWKLDQGVDGKRGHRYNIQIPKKDYLIGEHKELPVPPYTLGVWLGDGSNTKPCITGSKEDIEILVGIVSDGYLISSSHTHKTTGCHSTYFEGLRVDLQKINMCYSRRRSEKHIPGEYLTASVKQRLELLAGLIDTDGSLSEGYKYAFTTSDERLKNDVVSLISTFGWRTTVIKYEPTTSSSGIVGQKHYWKVQFCPDCHIPCRLVRKQNKSIATQRMIAIKSIERVEPKQGNCISVEGGIYLAGRTLIPTHNSTLGIFFLSWVMGKFPDQPNLASAHADKLTRSFYDGVMQILTDPEYCWSDVFPEVKFESNNAKDETINLGKRNRFKTLTCRSIDGSLTGATRCEKILYADDLCSGIEEAMSKERLDKLWEKYTNDLKSRKKLGCKEIHIATRWSVHDVIGRLERMYEDDPRAKFIVLPALDENDESNFNYDYGVGFDTAYFHDMRNNLDDVSFRCLFMNQPIEREGLLYHEGELRRYFDLPGAEYDENEKLINFDEPDAIIGICDTKDTGTDYEFLPVLYQYGQDYYLEDCICDNSKTEILDERCAVILVKHKVQACRFESNNAGGRTADVVQKRVKELKGITHITKKFTTTNKETKIIVNSPWVKEHVLFKDKSLIKPNTDYRKMMNFLTTYTLMGKNKNDDVPDGMAQFALFVQSLSAGKVVAIKRPF